METAKDILLLLQAVAGILFSAFMMYSMFKTKKAVEKGVKNITELKNNLEDTVPVLLAKLNPPRQFFSEEEAHLPPVEIPEGGFRIPPADQRIHR